MKRKVLALIVSACTVVSIMGCGSKEISNDYITVSKYKGVEVEKVETPKVTDEDVTNSINSSLEQMKTTTEVTDRAVQDTDTATLDYVGKLDGVEFEGGSAADAQLTIGSNQFIEGFEAGLIGHSIGETFDLPITFPEDYANTELAGKPVVFTVTIKGITANEVPKLDDTMVATLSQKSKTVEEYKKEVKADLKKSNEESAKATLGDSVMAVIVKNTKVKKYPEKDVTAMTEKLTEQYKQRAEYFQMEFADFLTQQMGMTEEQFNEEAKKAAQSGMQQKLAVELIAKQENLIPTEKQYAEEYKTMAKTYGFTDVEDMKKQVGEDDLKTVVLQEKVNAWLVENCKQVEKKATTDTTTKDTKTEDKESK